MFKSNYDRARKAIPPCRRECAPRKYNSKWRKKENIELIKKAVNAYKKNSDLTKAAEILGVKTETLRGYICTPTHPIYKYFLPHKPAFDRVKHFEEIRHMGRLKIIEHKQSCKDAGLDYKSYFSHLKQTCPDKRATTQEIKSLNESINHLIDTKKSEQELKVLREKLRLAKQFFRSQRY